MRSRIFTCLTVSPYKSLRHYKGRNSTFTRKTPGKCYAYQVSKVTITKIKTNRPVPPDTMHQEGHSTSMLFLPNAEPESSYEEIADKSNRKPFYKINGLYFSKMSRSRT